MGRLHGLAIDPEGRGRRRGPGVEADLLPDAGVDAFPDAVVPPGPEVPVDGLPGREVVGEQPPGRPAAEVVEDGVEDLAERGRRPAALGGSGLRFREEGFEGLPLGVGQVGVVMFSCHAREK